MKVLAHNRRAVYDYDLLEHFEAGVMLLGTEVKSVRAGHVSLNGSFVTVHGGTAYLTNATIPPWQAANAPADYDPTRSRRLLLTRDELDQITGSHTAKGLTIVPLRIYTKGPHIKVEVALARGKRRYNKKQQKKERDIRREMDRVLRGKDV